MCVCVDSLRLTFETFFSDIQSDIMCDLSDRSVDFVSQ